MKRAVKLPRYSDPKPFPAQAGIASAEIDPESGELADASCPDARVEYFVAGTEPHQFCRLHSGSQPQIAGSPAATIPASPQP